MSTASADNCLKCQWIDHNSSVFLFFLSLWRWKKDVDGWVWGVYKWRNQTNSSGHYARSVVRPRHTPTHRVEISGWRIPGGFHGWVREGARVLRRMSLFFSSTPFKQAVRQTNKKCVDTRGMISPVRLKLVSALPSNMSESSLLKQLAVYSGTMHPAPDQCRHKTFSKEKKKNNRYLTIACYCESVLASWSVVRVLNWVALWPFGRWTQMRRWKVEGRRK